MRIYKDIGVQVPHILLPRKEIDLTKWAVIACDQYTSQPEYWERVKQIISDSPSTHDLILPEFYLDQPQVGERIHSIHAKMHEYLNSGLFESHEGMVYVERIVGGKIRRGLVLALDLELYDYHPDVQNLIHASEGVMAERLLPRVRIRRGAPLELSHVLVLIDDPKFSVVEPVSKEKPNLIKCYDFDLMFDSGHFTGYLIDDMTVEKKVIQGLRGLARPDVFCKKYNLGKNQKVLLYAIGDGNHSLAAAKTLWDQVKPKVGMNHPARYSLVEIQNIHDQNLTFGPINRLLFNLKRNIFSELEQYFGQNYSFTPYENSIETMAHVINNNKTKHTFGLVTENKCGVVTVNNPRANLPIGTLQAFLDKFFQTDGVEKVDYVHGEEAVCIMGTKSGNAGFCIPAMNKDELFKTIILNGILPKKSFSMGEAREKRFYVECRKII